MILTEFKPFDEILEKLKDEKKIFILGCGGCPEGAETGGKKVLNEVKNNLKKEGKIITGVMEIDFLCQKSLIRTRIRKRINEIEEADSLLIYSCGIGVQAAATVTSKLCVPALNTKSFSGITGIWQGTERCDTCGNCVLDLTAGICPYTACPKKLLNGACAGQSNGKCETDPERDCGWELIYKNAKKMGKIDKLYEFIPPRNYKNLLPPAELRKSSLWALDEEEVV